MSEQTANKVEDKTVKSVPASDRDTTRTDNAPKNERFEVCLSKFQANIQKAMKYVREASEIALRHFEATGDLVYCQRLFDTIPANYGRRAAFARWLLDHAPVKFNQGKFTKDKSDKALPFMVEEACKIAFWEHSPDTQIIPYTGMDVVTATLKTLQKYGGDKYAAKDDAAIEMRTKLEKAVRAVVEQNNAQKPIEEHVGNAG